MNKWFMGFEINSGESKYVDLDEGRTPHYIGKGSITMTSSFNNSLEQFLIKNPSSQVAFIGSRPDWKIINSLGDNICPNLNSWDTITYFLKAINYEMFLRKKYPKQYSPILLIFDGLNWIKMGAFLNNNPMIKACFKEIINYGYKYNICCIIKTDLQMTNAGKIVKSEYNIYSEYFNLYNIEYGESLDLLFKSDFIEYDRSKISYVCTFTEFTKLKVIASKLAFLDTVIDYKTRLFKDIDIPIYLIEDNSTHLQELAEVFNEMIIVSQKN